jgi:hypothetical protein
MCDTSHCQQVGSPELYRTLLKIYLQPKHGEQALLEPALALLQQHSTFINVTEVSRIRYG